MVQPAARGENDKAPHAKAPPPAPARVHRVRSRVPAVQAWERLAAPLKKAEGIRVAAVGVTGVGKTTAMIDFLNYLQANRLVTLVLVHDIKGPRPQYDGQIIHEASTALSHPPKEWPATLVLRRRGMDHTPSVEDAARITKAASYHGVPTMLVVDEFNRAVSPSGREITCPSVGELFSEGRALGASMLWTTQLPQRVPTQAWDQSQVMLFRSGSKARSYLDDADVIDRPTAAVVAGLGVGEFVIVGADEDFDGQIYEVPPP